MSTDAADCQAIIGDSAAPRRDLAGHQKVALRFDGALQGDRELASKLFVARFITLPRVANRPFVAITRARHPDTLIENELFAHEKGSFTVLVVAADREVEPGGGGTIFLDEIGELRAGVQSEDPALADRSAGSSDRRDG